MASVLWSNLSPFYAKKEQIQEETMDFLDHEVGTFMKMLNDVLPRTRTSGEVDKKTMQDY